MIRTFAPLLFLALLASNARAGNPEPGSALVFPVHHSQSAFTLVSVSNTRTGSGGDVRALYKYVNVTPNPADPLNPPRCELFWRAEQLTPGDTVTILTGCHNEPGNQNGYLIVTAQDATFGFATSHNHLIGSELVLYPNGLLYSIQPASFKAIGPPGTPTDADFDGKPDLDGVEYEKAPDTLYLDSFLGIDASRLVLFNLTGDIDDSVVTVSMDIFNDNELPLSFTFQFTCWFEVPLADLSTVFTQAYLASTPDDPDEFDYTCDGQGDVETGWARIDATVASSPFGTRVNPAILGAVAGQPQGFEGGRLLWGDGENDSGEL